MDGGNLSINPSAQEAGFYRAHAHFDRLISCCAAGNSVNRLKAQDDLAKHARCPVRPW
jgi:hypothetical protein